MKETRAERKARKAELRAASRRAKEAKNVAEVPHTKGEATIYATPAETTGPSVPDTTAPVVVATERVWTGSNEALPDIHGVIDSWGGGVQRRDHADIAARVDKLTRRVKSREVVVQETVTEFVEVPAEDAADEAEAPAAPAPVKSSKRVPRALGFFGPKSSKKRVDAAVASRSEDAWDPSERRAPARPAKKAKGPAPRKAAKKGGRKKR